MSAATATAGTPPVAPVRRRVRLGPRPRPVRRALITVGVILILALCWLVVRGALATRDLQRGRTALTAAQVALGGGHAALAVTDLDRAAEQASRATTLTGDPVWHLAGHLPLIGVNLRTVHSISLAATDAARASTPLLTQLAGDLAAGGLRGPHDAIDLAAVSRLAPTIADTGAGLQAALDTVAATSTSGLAPVTRARNQLLTELAGLSGTVTAAQRVVSLAPAMMGASGPRRYLIALQNPAEARGTGGYLGAFAVITADQGSLHLDLVGTDDELYSPTDPVVTVSADFTARWRALGGDSYWGNANLTPDFPDAATVWEALYRKETGKMLDGVLALNPDATGALVSALGGITLPDGTHLAGPDVPAYLESVEYLRYPTDLVTRRVQVRALVADTFGRITAGSTSPFAVVSALSRSAAGGGVLIASTHADEEASLVTGGVAGQLPETDGPFADAIVDNAGGNKMDYYLDRSLTYRSLGCSGSTRSSTISVTLHNAAPGSGLPLYVAGYDNTNPAGRFALGTDRSLLSVYAAVGARLASASLDGTPVTVTSGVEHRHPVFTTYLDISPGQSRTLTLQLTEPSDGAPVPVRPQALPRPEQVVLQTDSCSVDAPLASISTD